MSSCDGANTLSRRPPPEPAPHAPAEDAARQSELIIGLLRVLAEAEGSEPAGRRLLGELAGVLGQPSAALWVARGDHLVLASTWSAAVLDREALDRALRTRRLARGVGFAGRAWERRAPIHLRTDGHPVEVVARDQLGDGLIETIAFPCSREQEVLAIVGLYGTAPVAPGVHLTEALLQAGRILGGFFARRRGELGLSPLSRRELEVLTLAGRGHSVREIAHSLTISPSTAKTHLEHIYRKLDVRDRTAAVAVGLRSGFIA